jgi:hypothetical protein
VLSGSRSSFHPRAAAAACIVLTAILAVALSSNVNDSRADAGAVRVSADPAVCRDAASWAAAQAAPPLCSIARAVQLAPPGGRILVAPGSYPALALSAARTDYVQVAADGTGPVTLPSITLQPGAEHLSFAGLNLAGVSGMSTFSVGAGVHHVQLLGSAVTSTGANAVDLAPGSSDMLFQGNTVKTSGGYGIVFNATSTAPGSPAGGRNDPPIARIAIRQNTFDGIDGDSVRPAAFLDVLVEGNEFRNQHENGDHVDALQTVWGGTNLTFRGNFVHDNQSQGLFIKDGQVTGLTVDNNILVRNPVPCATCGDVQLYLSGIVNAKVVNNTVWDNGTNVTIGKDVQNLALRNNLFAYMDVVPGAPDGTSTWVQERNIIAGGNTGSGTSADIKARPAFVNAAAEDYRLKGTSPGVDAGTGTDAPAVDKACGARFDAPGVSNSGRGTPGYVDLGALEYHPDSTAADTAARLSGSCPVPAPGPDPGTPAPPQPAPAGTPPVPGLQTTKGAGSAVTVPCGCTSAKGANASSKCHLGRVLRAHRGIALRMSSSVSCRVRVSVTARWRRGRARAVTVRRTLAPNRTVTVKVVLPRAARRVLGLGRHVTLTIRMVGVPKRGATRTLSGIATLKR